MRDVPRVRGRERCPDLARGSHHFARGRPAAAGDLLTQRVTVDELTRNEELAVELLERVDRADARVLQRRRGARLPSQPFTLQRIVHQIRWQRLEGDRTAESRIGGQVDSTHASASDLTDNCVGADHLSGFEDFVFTEKIRDTLDDGARQECTHARVMVEQRADFSSDLRVVARFAVQPFGHVRWPLLDRAFEQFTHPLPLCLCHEGQNRARRRLVGAI